MRSVLKLFMPLLALQVVALLAGIVLYPNWRDALTVPLTLPFAYIIIGPFVVPDKTRPIVYVGTAVLFGGAAATLTAIMIDSAIDHISLILLTLALVVIACGLTAVAVYESRPYRRR